MKISLNKFVVRAFFLLTLFIFAFVNFNGSTVFHDYTVPFIEGHPVVIHTVLSAAMAVLTIFVLALCKRGFRADKIFICMLIKTILDFAQVIFNDELKFDTYFWYFAITLVSFLTYIIYANQRIDEKDDRFFRNGIICFGVVLSLQTIYTAINCGIPYMNLSYKTAMVIPYGGTNIIAAMLVPIMAMIYCSVGNKRVKIILIALFAVSVVLTKSRGGMLLAVIVLFFFLYRGATERNKNKAIRAFLLIVLGIVFVIVMLTNETVLSVLAGYTYGSGKSLTLNSILSGRLKGITSVFDEASKHSLLFGYGMQTLNSSEAAGAHNIIVDLIGKCGLIGFVNYFVMFIYIIKKGRELSRDKLNPLFAMVVIIYINSLYEVCYFSYACDALLWTFIGIMMSQYYTKKAVKAQEDV